MLKSADSVKRKRLLDICWRNNQVVAEQFFLLSVFAEESEQLSLLLEVTEESLELPVTFSAFSEEFFVDVSAVVDPELLHNLLL